MLAEKAYEFIKEVRRQNDGTNSVPPYDETSLRHTFDEMQVLFEQNQKAVTDSEDIDDNGEMFAGIHLRHAALERNKQCVLAYSYSRLERIRDMRWTKGSVLPEADQLNMTDNEIEFFTAYNKELASYMQAVGTVGEMDGLDLTENFHPPKCSMVFFRVLEDYGEFEVEGGEPIVLKKNCVHNLPRHLCEGLEKQGVIQIISNKKK